MSDEKTWVCGCNYVRPVWASQPCQVCGWSGPGDGEIDIQKHGNTATDNNCHSPDIVEMLRDGGYGFVDDRELTAAAEIERLRARLAEAERLLREWVADAHWNPRANLPDLVNRTRHAIGAARATDSAPAAHKKIAELDATHQLWRESHTQPPPEEPEFVLVVFTSGDQPVVEASRSEYVRAYPDEYPYWMPLPNAPTATVSADAARDGHE